MLEKDTNILGLVAWRRTLKYLNSKNGTIQNNSILGLDNVEDSLLNENDALLFLFLNFLQSSILFFV